jgi:NADPH-dependent curcumin reductase CurA
MTTVNRQVTLAARPVGFPKISDFGLAFAPLRPPAGGEVLIRSIYLSLDSCMRGRMNVEEAYAPSFAVGEMIAGAAVGYVLESKDPDFGPGDVVQGMLGWQEFAVVAGRELRKIDPSLAPISTALGVLGMPGLTAYFGLLDICHPQPEETVVVSGAAGGVGMIVGQIARIKGSRAVGVAGSDAKVAWLVDELGFDAAFNYRTATDLQTEMGAFCDTGVDVYFDNVGGATTDAIVQCLNSGARICFCGQLSQYNLESPEQGPRWLGKLIVREAKAQGFRVSSYAHRFAEGLQQLARWLVQGKLKYREDVAQGLESAPQAFIGMLHGKNQGKQLVQLSELDRAHAAVAQAMEYGAVTG